jgi:TolB-like protein/class 3 adenylate cyclase/Tfp pilus assembly protein PilF
MSSGTSSEVKLEIGHVLFIDIVGYSQLLITQQSEQIETLRRIVRGTAEFRAADAEGKLIRLPTGDGGALVFRTTPEAPVLCALEISQELKKHPELRVRLGIHSGPVNAVTDLNEQSNIAGAGINIAQRVMDCGDAGHILVSKHVAEDLEHYPRWQPYLHELGACEVKHRVRVSVVNFYTDEVGNPALPEKFRTKPTVVAELGPKRAKPILPIAIGIAAIGGIAVLAAVILPSILRSRENAKTNRDEVLPAAAKSIAVLPFENLSRDPDNAYFVEGIQDEILTRLSKIADLKVISRTSTMKYKSAPDNLRDVGRQLGVANLLEGSVQKIANAVHVNVQLIRAASDEHLWAESYNRTLNDVFGVEGEVARAISDQLNAKLSGAEQKAVTEKPTQNSAAYDAYLRALSIEHNNYSYEAYVQAERGYEQAVQLDPNFALAWARLGIIRSFLYFNAIELSKNNAITVKDAADHAMALAPEAGESWVAQGAYLYRVQRDFEGALAAYREAQKRLPNSALVFEYLGFVQRRVGRWEEAETNYKKARELDPLDIQLLSAMGAEFYVYLRRFDDALASIDRAMQIGPDPTLYAAKAQVLQSAGRLGEARHEIAQIPDSVLNDWVIACRVQQTIYERNFDEAIKVIEQKLDSIPRDQPLDSFEKQFLVQLGQYQEWSGRAEEARRAYSRAVAAIKPTPDTVVTPDANGTPYNLAVAYAGLNDKQQALQQAQDAVKAYETDAIQKPQAEIILAQTQTRFGDHDSAIAALAHLLEVPAGLTVANLKFDPLWDPLRKDPRFQKLCEETAK